MTLTDRGFNSLAAAIHHLLDNNDPTLVVNKLSSIETLVSDMDEDVSKRILGAAGSVLEKMNNHVNALENRIKILEEKPPAVVSPSPTGPVSRIPQSTVITLDDGTTVMSVGELGAKLKTLQKQSSILQEAFEAQGGVTYNGTNYTSEKELEQVVARDMPGGAHFNVFVNPVDVFSHHKEAKEVDHTTTSEGKMLLSQGCESSVDRAFILAQSRANISCYHNQTSQILPGELMEVIKSKEKWEGTDGHASTIMTKLKSSVQSVNRAIKDNLKQGSELQLMAYQMALDCQTFHNHVISHISSEFMMWLLSQMLVLSYRRRDRRWL